MTDRNDNDKIETGDTGPDPEKVEGQTENNGSGSARRGRRRKRRALLWCTFVCVDILVVVGIALLLGGAILAGRDMPAPDWVADRAGSVLSQGLGGGRVDVGHVTLKLAHRSLPEVAFGDVRVIAPDGDVLVTVPSLGVSLDKSALLQRKVQPKALRVQGASVRMKSKADGTLDLGFGDGLAPASLGTVQDAVAVVQRTFALPGMDPIHRIEVQELDVRYEDQRAERVWHVTDGSLVLTQDPDSIAMSIDLTLPDTDPANAVRDEIEPATVALRVTLGKSGPEARLSALVKSVAAADIAAQGPGLSWLKPLDARVSGTLITGLNDAGDVAALNGTLEIGAGAFQPEASANPIPFDGARAVFGYLPQEAKLRFDMLELESPDGGFAASGHAYLEGFELGWPTALVGQLEFSDVRLDPTGVLPRPAQFPTGVLDLKVELDPFIARIGRFVLTVPGAEGGDVAGASRLEAAGRVTADSDGWHVALDMSVDRIDTGPMLALWPLQLVPQTRDWIARHLIGGQVYDAHAGIRIDQEQRPDVSLTFEFRDTALRVLDDLPPITGAAGYASVGRGAFSLSLDQGWVSPPEGGKMDLAGSAFTIGDMETEPRIGEILWQSSSSITSALSLLDQKPFGFMQRAGQPVTLADGNASLGGRISFPMKRRIAQSDVDFDIAGTLTQVTSEKSVPDRLLTSDRIALGARPEGLTLAGPARLDGVPLEATFTLPFQSEDPDLVASVEGAIDIGETFVTAFGIGLPEQSVTGAGPANFRLDLMRDSPPGFSLSSSLAGVGLSLPSLGWSKPADTDGALTVSGQLGDLPAITSLSLDAAGLAAEGAITLTPDGGLDQARFDRVRLEDWLDAPVTLTGRGAGQAPQVTITGGQIDLRRSSSSGGTGGSATDPPIILALDRLQISDGLFLAPFSGQLASGPETSGNFTGNVNGQAPVAVALSPGRGGEPAITLRSDNAGAVFRASGLFRSAEGGSMALRLDPRAERGEYDGQLKVERIRVRGASGLVALANAISVVGLLDQLNGSGIVLSDVEAAFRLTPRFVQVTRSSGVGPSLGISMEGVYDMASDTLDMQGVFSPVYMVNAIGSIFTRRGEGLFGVTYRMRGPSANPSVDVNPLSMLTPGMFREIFRAPPPQPRTPG